MIHNSALPLIRAHTHNRYYCIAALLCMLQWHTIYRHTWRHGNIMRQFHRPHSRLFLIFSTRQLKLFLMYTLSTVFYFVSFWFPLIFQYTSLVSSRLVKSVTLSVFQNYSKNVNRRNVNVGWAKFYPQSTCLIETRKVGNCYWDCCRGWIKFHWFFPYRAVVLWIVLSFSLTFALIWRGGWKVHYHFLGLKALKEEHKF